MRIAAATVVLSAVLGSALAAQGRWGSQGIPPGQLPPAGQCRVWYDNVPPGQQPRASSCQEAERIAARNRNARVIYGSSTRASDARYGRYPSSPSYPGRYPDERARYGFSSVPFENGYTDGYAKGREDARDDDNYDPSRHSRFRSGDHGYDRRFGTKDQYKDIYREGFRAGYDSGYRDNLRYSSDRRPLYFGR